MQPEDALSCIWSGEETQKPQESLDQIYWKKIFIVLCLCAVPVDALFLYIPILKDDFKCLMLDSKLKIAVLLLRSIIDFFHLMDIIIRIYRSKKYSGLINELNHGQHRMNFSFDFCVPRIAKAIWSSKDILIDIVVLLPLPQVAILIFFSKMNDLRSLTTTRMVFMNIFALLQYMPRVFRIYLSSMELKGILEEVRETPVWTKGVLNFCMYIIASHVFGALWYFFAIQRMMMCWHSACHKNDGCDNRVFGCHDHHAFRNTTILNDLCHVNVSDNSSEKMFFDFGIFATVLKYGVEGSTNYFKKFLNCFWWGLRNLSSFGSNLEPSADGWENLYTVFISITGLLLFLYLIGNLQMYMQLESTRSDNRMQMRRKMKGKDKEIELWLFKNGIPTRLIKDFKLQIMEKVKQAAQEDTDTDLDNILPLLPSDVQSRIKEPFAKLKQVPMLRGIYDVVFKIICQKLEPVRYTENSLIIQKGEQLDKMFYLLDGDVSIEEGSSDDLRRGAGELCGEELLRWPFYSYFPHRKPLATESVKAIGVVEALALNASDLQSIYDQYDIVRKEASRHRRMMKVEMETNISGLIRRKEIPEEFNQEIMEKIEEQFQKDDPYWDKLDWDHLVSHLPLDFQIRCMALTKLNKVPMLRGMDEGLLKLIYEKLKPVRYTENNFIIQKDKSVEKMVYIVDGDVSIEERSSDDSRRGAGELFGEEFLRLPFSTDFPFTRPLATESVKAIGVVEAVALNLHDLESIYMQSYIFEKEKPRHRRMIKEEIERNIDGLIRINGIPERLYQNVKSRIMKELFEEDKTVYWDFLDWYHLVSHLPPDFRNEIKRYMPLTKLEEMSTFQNMKESVLKELCCLLRPMKYYHNNAIIEKSGPIQMLLIVEGRIGYGGCVKGAGEIYGEELLVWPFSTSFPDKVPTAAESPFVITDVVEALVLTASDMKSVATEFRKHFIKNYDKFVQTWAFKQKWSFDRCTYDYSEGDIKEATRNYTCLNYPNEGGYGTVYHTELDGRAVAIKTCNRATGDPFIQSQHLVHEAFVLSQINHKNVVRLSGCCFETRWPIMIYDRTSTLTLVEHFHRNKSKLSLESRMKIAAEIAGALAHVHSKSIVHGDVKTTNILIDHTTHTVKVTGFGALRLLHEDEVSTLPGTSRCLDPEYLKSHDVYSFGVVLVELLTRQEAVSSDRPERSLANDFVRSVQEDRLGPILDGEIKKDKFSFEMAKKVSELAVTCLRPRGEERPSMGEVAEELDGVVQTIINRGQVGRTGLPWASSTNYHKERSRGEERPSMEEVAAELEGVVQTIINRVELSTVDNNISSASRTS